MSVTLKVLSSFHSQGHEKTKQRIFVLVKEFIFVSESDLANEDDDTRCKKKRKKREKKLK